LADIRVTIRYQNKMLFKALYKYNRHFVLIILFCLTECIIDPIGNFPLNDDWWYAKTIQHFLDHKPGFVSWSSSTQVGQTFSAFLFAKLVGSTFTALRFYTLTLSLIGILVFYDLCSIFILIRHYKSLIVVGLLLDNCHGLTD
jgi:type IV secretory pathway VirB6-like protein